MFPIVLPEYRIKAQVNIQYAEWNGTYLESKVISIDEEWDPTPENVDHLIALHVLSQWQSEVRRIYFTADQPLNKVRYGQACLVDGESQVTSFEYSYFADEYRHDSRTFQRRSMRRNTDRRNDENNRLYIK